MRQSVGFLPSKELISIFIIGIILTGFVGFLLLSNYQSLQKLRTGALTQYENEFYARGSNLAHFLDNQRQLVTTVANGSKLELYFENKALGMSMQYGLRSTLLALELELNQFVRQSRIGDDCIFEGILICDHMGAAVAKSDAMSSILHGDSGWRQVLFQLPEGFYTLQSTEKTKAAFFYTRPLYFKGKYAAQVVAIFSPKVIRSRFLKTGRAALFTGLFASSEHLLGEDAGQVSPFPPPPDHILLSDNLYQKWLMVLEASEPVLTFETTVGKTNLQLKEISSAKMIIGAQSPRTLLLAMVLLFIGLLGAAVFIIRTGTHNLVLQTRVEEARKREKDIAIKNKQLEAEIEERKRSEAAQIQLEGQLQRVQKMEAIGMLAGGVAHDLNNILTGIVSYPDLLLMQLPEGSSLRDPIQTIKKSGQKATAIVQDLLTLARRGVVVNEIVSLNAIVVDYLQSPEHHKMLSFHKGVHITMDLEENIFNVLGSPVHLSKSIMNLVSNAAEAMTDGGEIVISTKSVYIEQPIGNYEKVNEGEYILLSIADTGSGMSREDSEKIFEPFFTKKAMGRSGTGLGMSVVWGTVKDHKGYIDVKTELGKGTTFDLYFPVTHQKKKTEPVALPVEDYRGNGETILIVDDLKEQREIAQKIFSKLGYSATTVESGEKATEYVEANTVDLVILDMIMDPGIDGLETYERILKVRPNQKAIITSGYSKTDRICMAKDLGVRQFIKKPYTLEKIALAVKAELGGNAMPDTSHSCVPN